MVYLKSMAVEAVEKLTKKVEDSLGFAVSVSCWWRRTAA
jgi:hypothetical protein